MIPVTTPRVSRVLFGGMAVVVMAAILVLHRASSPAAYAAVFLGASMAYLLFAWSVFHTEPSPKQIVAVLLFALLVRASFLTAMPIGSDDVYRYMWDGKVQAAGIDPYQYAPGDSALAGLHSALVPALVNHPDMHTLYFPFTQWVFRLCYGISGEAIWGYKAVLLLAEILTVMALVRIAGVHGSGRKFALLYALCPLPILQVALDAHVDGLGFPFLAWGLLAYLGGKKGWGYVLLGLSMAVKPVALVLLPLLAMNEKGIRHGLAALLVPLLVFGAQFLPYFGSPHLFEALFTFTRHWTFNGPLFEAVNAFIADNQRARMVCGIVLCASLALLLLARLRFESKISHAILLLLICSPVVHPWYVAWLVVMIPLARMRSAILLAATASLTAFTILAFRQSGIWEQYPLAIAVEYIPVVVVFGRELFSREGR